MAGQLPSVGDRIEVFWEEEQGWFWGKITNYDPDRNFSLHIDYDDDDQEWVRCRQGGYLDALKEGQLDAPNADFILRQYRLDSAQPAAAAGQALPVKRKRGRPPGSGRKAKGASGNAAGAQASAPAGGRAANATAAQQPEQQEGSPKKRRRAQPAAVSAKASSSSQYAPGAANDSSQRVHAAEATPAEPAVQPASAMHEPIGAANGTLVSRGSGEPAASAAQPPCTSAAMPFKSPSIVVPRDPRKLPAPSGGALQVRASPAQPTVGPQQTQQQQEQQEGEQRQQQEQQQEEQQQAVPAPALPTRVVSQSVIAHQFAMELATVSGEPGEGTPRATAGGGAGSRGTTPGLLYSTSRASSGQLAGSTPGGEGLAAAAGSQQEEGPGAAPGGGLPDDEDIARQVACRNFERMLANLSRTKESIGKATGLALQAAKCNAGPKLIRMVLERMGMEESNQQRVNLFYLIDSILQTSMREREGRSDCGPKSPAGQTYPRVVGAALTKLIEAVARDVQATDKLEKVLMIWQRKAIISETLLQPALLLARTKRAQHDAAWGDADLGPLPTSNLEVAADVAAAAAPGLGGAAAVVPHSSAGGQAVPAAAGRKALPLSGPEAEAGLWRLWRRLPMNAVLRLKFIDQKSGNKVVLTQRPQSNEWEEMSALCAEAEARGVNLASPSRADEPLVYADSSASSWDGDSSMGGSPAPDASPWHWPLLREAKRSAAAAAVAQEHARRAAAAAEAARWVQLAASHKQHQQQLASSEPDEFDQEMLQQMAGGAAANPGAAPSQSDVWSQLSTMEMEAYQAAPWNLPGAGAAAAGEGAAPPLPAGPPPPLDGEGQPPLPDEDDFNEGPPPLPAYSPPHDEYAPAEFGGQPPLPPMPPPEEEDGGGEYGDMDLMGTSPEFQPPPPPLPPEEQQQQQQQQLLAHVSAAGEPAHSPASPSHPPLLPPGIGVRQPALAAATGLPHTSSAAHAPAAPPSAAPAAPLSHHHPPVPHAPPTASAEARVHVQAGGSAGPGGPAAAAAGHALLGQPSCTLRSWTGFVTEIAHGSHGIVDGQGPDSGFFSWDIVQGGGLLEVGTRVRCEGQEYGSQAPYRWCITRIRRDGPGGMMEQDDTDFGNPDYGHAAAQHHHHHHHQGQQQHQQQLQQHLSLGQRTGSWHSELYAVGGEGAEAEPPLLSGPPPGFGVQATMAAHMQHQQHPWAGGMGAAHGDVGYGAAQPMQQQQQQQQAYQPLVRQPQPGAGQWPTQGAGSNIAGMQQPGMPHQGSYPPGWGHQ